jgi:hypothetical protein
MADEAQYLQQLSGTSLLYSGIDANVDAVLMSYLSQHCQRG